MLARIAALLRQAEGTDNTHEAEAFMAAPQRLATATSIDLAVARAHSATRTAATAPVQRTITIGEVPPYLPKAFVAIEDKRFYEHNGVDATGITLSRNQHAHVSRLIEEKGLGGRVRMELLDYRKLDESVPYDKIASVGMFEHVGRAQLESYFAKLRRLLKPGGLIMNHGITAAGVYNAELGNGMGEFIEKYIFPGGELTHISVVLETLTNGGLEEVDVENLRPHYARTLWAWSDALEARLPEAAQILSGPQGERSLRAYRLYLAGCAMGFEHGWIALHQVLAQPPAGGRADELDDPADLAYPWRRDYMYQER